MAETKFSVIIPTLNEENMVADRIGEIRRSCPRAQVIVSDGGSTDRTVMIAENNGAMVVRSTKGRGSQCNRGAVLADGQVLVFLHADTQLPAEAFGVLERSFQDDDTRIGTFRMKLDIGHHVLRFYSLCNYLDSVFTRFGDQCICVRRDFFDMLGGFPELEYFEDVEFLQKARKLTGIRLFPATVVTSGRRFRGHGILRQYLFDGWLMIQYFFGVPAPRLAKKYASFKDRGKR